MGAQHLQVVALVVLVSGCSASTGDLTISAGVAGGVRLSDTPCLLAYDFFTSDGSLVDTCVMTETEYNKYQAGNTAYCLPDTLREDVASATLSDIDIETEETHFILFINKNSFYPATVNYDATCEPPNPLSTSDSDGGTLAAVVGLLVVGASCMAACLFAVKRKSQQQVAVPLYAAAQQHPVGLMHSASQPASNVPHAPAATSYPVASTGAETKHDLV